MRLGWGWKITLLYSGFVVFMTSLVIASNKQKFDLVSDDYYEEEIAYQKVLDAGKNQSDLSRPISVHANGENVIIDFPDEFKTRPLSGDILFYSPVNAEWDRDFTINAANNSVSVSRKMLRDTHYIIKIKCSAGGKNYYQESEIILHS